MSISTLPPPPPPLDAMLVHRKVTPSIIAGTHLYTWLETGTVRVKCLALEHNTIIPTRARTWIARSREEGTNHEATAPLFAEGFPWPPCLIMIDVLNIYLYSMAKIKIKWRKFKKEWFSVLFYVRVHENLLEIIQQDNGLPKYMIHLPILK